MQSATSNQKTAFILSLLILVIALGCLAWIASHSGAFAGILSNTDDASPKETQLIADIYQNGELLESISLSTVTENYTFTVTGDNGAENEIQVRPGSIGILSANCPDKLCVHQGFITSSLLPITCLPNHLVIQVHVQEEETKEPNSSNNEDTPDIITY